MKSIETQPYKTVSLATRASRTFAGLVIEPFLGVKVINPDGLSRSTELAQQGYGSLILSNHFSLGDPPRAIIIAIKNLAENREILTPFGIHQIKTGYNLLARMMGITVCPVTNDGTLKYIEKHPEKALKFQYALTRKGAAELLSEYLKKQAPSVLGRGGLVFLYPQGERSNSLKDVTNAVSTLINRTTRYGVDRFAIMFIGIGPQGVENYEDEAIRGLNVGSTYEFMIGKTLTKAELIEEAKKCGISIDQLVLKELGLVVPPSYLPRR